jgi:hypothetical protein
MNWIKQLFTKKETTKQCDIHVVSESLKGFTIKNSTFVQTNRIVDKTEEKLKPSSGDVFDNCTFYVRKGRAAINFR